MKIRCLIFYSAGTCNEVRVLNNLRKIIPEVIVVSQKCSNLDIDAELAQILFNTIHLRNTDALFSLDYYPIIAEVSHTVGIPYISWIMDAPHYTLYSTTSFYPENYIFHFDSEEAERLKSMGRPNVFHQHLATDPEFFMRCLKREAPKKYEDIAFLGASYQDKYDYFEQNNDLSDYDKGLFEAVIKAQSLFSGLSIIQKVLPESKQRLLIDACNIHYPETYDIPESLIAANILEKKLSVRERKRVVSELGEHYGIILYSDSNALSQKGVLFKGYADYEKEMPFVFYYSRINLNHTLRSIHSGIPLRALDIMACGGFLLSNYQPEIEEWFNDGVSVAIYDNIEDMVEKAGWYLQHDDLRSKIAIRGYEIICKEFTYECTLQKIIEIVCDGGVN